MDPAVIAAQELILSLSGLVRSKIAGNARQANMRPQREMTPRTFANPAMQARSPHRLGLQLVSFVERGITVLPMGLRRVMNVCNARLAPTVTFYQRLLRVHAGHARLAHFQQIEAQVLLMHASPVPRIRMPGQHQLPAKIVLPTQGRFHKQRL